MDLHFRQTENSVNYHKSVANMILPAAENIRKEYDQSAALAEEWQKAKWASEQSMRARFHLAMKLMPFAGQKKWLDVGAGPGTFQAMALARFPDIFAHAIDISPALVAYAKKQPDRQKCSFEFCDFLDYGQNGFDLLTCIGVLQRSNFFCDSFFEKAREILKPNGSLFLDTKTREWEKFVSGELTPDPHLQWFSLKEVEETAKKYAFQISVAAGFDPHRGKIVRESASSSIFILATRG